MKSKKDFHAEVDDQGRLVLPPAIAVRYGLKPGDRVAVTPAPHSFRVRQPVSRLAKIYIEPTNRCNLSCRTCIRNTWDEPMGLMSGETFEALISGTGDQRESLTVLFGGLGEPLLHPDILDMVASARQAFGRVELITNATLLSEDLSRRLIQAGLDRLWVSIDGARPESYADVRLGAALPQVLENISRFRDLRHIHHTRIGIVFVAMKRNIAELPDVLLLGRKLGADRFLITNVIAYTEALCEEVLYTDALWADSIGAPSPMAPQISATRIDLNKDTLTPLYRSIRGWRLSNYAEEGSVQTANYCPFVESGSMAVAWDGSVSPCLPLMHSHQSFLHDRRRFSKRFAVGRVNGAGDLQRVWDDPGYRALRRRVQDFDFPPCTHCGGCKLSQANEDDCYGSGFPTCGGCLWARGIVRCP